MSLFSSKLSSAPAINQSQGGTSVTSIGSAPQATGFTIESVKEAVPSHMRASVSQDLVDKLNQVSSDPIIAENVRDNFISYGAILKEGRFKLDEYLNAVAYVSYKVMGNTNEEAYSKTFPVRYSNLIAKNTAKKDIASYVHAYNKGKLVNLILEQTLIPVWVLNQDIYQRAINKQMDLMLNATSEKVQQEAANSILTHLAKPKDTKLQISIGETENAGMSEMRELMKELATRQRNAISNGEMKTIDVAAQEIITKDD